jgi:hypothetical protein
MAKCQNVTIEGVNVPQSYYKAYGTTCRRQKGPHDHSPGAVWGMFERRNGPGPGPIKSRSIGHMYFTVFPTKIAYIIKFQIIKFSYV